MEPSHIRDEVHNFTRACQALAGFAHAHTGLTALERETVSNFVRALEEEVGPFAPASSSDDPPLASTVPNMPPIDWPTGRWSEHDKSTGS